MTDLAATDELCEQLTRVGSDRRVQRLERAQQRCGRGHAGERADGGGAQVVHGVVDGSRDRRGRSRVRAERDELVHRANAARRAGPVIQHRDERLARGVVAGPRGVRARDRDPRERARPRGEREREQRVAPLAQPSDDRRERGGSERLERRAQRVGVHGSLERSEHRERRLFGKRRGRERDERRVEDVAALAKGQSFEPRG
jgi:hypothetical protein